MVDILNPPDILLKSISVNEQNNSSEKEVYFYHSDHLGSAAWITDAKGSPVQYLMYAPYGEQLLNQQSTTTYNERFTFTGKERDEETGYDYFGARNYLSALSIWGAVDPLADKYIYNSPYVYCDGNPVKFIDSDGRYVETAWDILNVGMDIASLKSNISERNISGAVVDGVGLVLDAAAMAFPVPGGAGFAIKAYRIADKVSDAGILGKGIDKIITATKNTYRKALQKATGKIGKGFEAHHTLPRNIAKNLKN